MTRKKVIKVIISLSLSLIMLCSLPLPAFAAIKDEPTIEPQWTSIATIDLAITFVGDSGNATGIARKQSTASHIEGLLYVYKRVGSSWVYVGEASGSKSVGSLGISVDFVCEMGVQYKAIFHVAAYTNGIGELESVNCLETCD